MTNELEFEIEQGPAWLLVQRASLQRLANETWNRDFPEISEAFRSEDARIGQLARLQLRGMGFEPDCEIDAEMEARAIEASWAVRRLAHYIGSRSSKIAKFLANHQGENSGN